MFGIRRERERKKWKNEWGNGMAFVGIERGIWNYIIWCMGGWREE